MNQRNNNEKPRPSEQPLSASIVPSDRPQVIRVDHRKILEILRNKEKPARLK